MAITSTPDELYRAVSRDGSIAVLTLVASQLTADAAERHHTSPLASAALGRALMGALLLSSGTQDGETLQIQFAGNGPIGSITVDTHREGQVRGFVRNPDVDLPPKDGKPDVGGALGIGLLTVDRNHPDWKEPYRGVVHLVTGEIATDLAYYLRESEQSPAAVGLGVLMSGAGEVEAAGGFLVRALPGSEEDALARIEANIAGLAPLSELVGAGRSAAEIASALLEGFEVGQSSSLAPEFRCTCSAERVAGAARLLGEEELRELASQEEPAEFTCQFCNAHYYLSPEELCALIRGDSPTH